MRVCAGPLESIPSLALAIRNTAAQALDDCGTHSYRSHSLGTLVLYTNFLLREERLGTARSD